MKCKISLSAVAAALIAVCVNNVEAHSGGLNKQGCHNNRKTGDYHCHGGQSSTPAQPEEDSSRPLVTPKNDDKADGTSSPFKNCAEARAMGAAPVRIGEPRYGPHLDRDGDGIGCEAYRGR